MRTQPLSAAVVFAAVSAAQAQDCLWTSHALSPQGYGRMVYHSGLQRVLFLATGGSSLTNIQIWSWDGAAWTLLSGNGPSARFYPGVAYDSLRGRVVLFGGATSNSGITGPAETWEWDGIAWTQSAVTGPSGRTSPGMAYDESRHRAVLFGGYIYTASSFTYLGDTWEWDGQAWTQAATTGPAPQGVSCFAYDSIRARTVLYGGLPSNSTRVLWEWDGAVWLQRPSVQRSATESWMVFDPGRARMIVGLYNSHETWELDTAAAAWTLRDPGVGPAGPAAFDLARSRAVVVNGISGAATLEYHGAAAIVPPSIIQQPYGGSSTCSPVVFSVQAGGTAITYQWRREGQPLTNGGNLSGVTTDRLTIDPVTSADAGSYDVVISNPCATIASNAAQLVVNTTCYANCDDSTTPPFLNVNDFVCFLNKFATGDTYANCTGGCNPPPCLNIEDFSCFLYRFAEGCCTAP